MEAIVRRASGPSRTPAAAGENRLPDRSRTPRRFANAHAARIAAFLLLAVELVLGGCARRTPAPRLAGAPVARRAALSRAKPSELDRLLLSAHYLIRGPRQAIPLWLAAGSMRISVHTLGLAKPASTPRYDFPAELAAWKLLASSWPRERAKGAPADRFLDALARVGRAGFVAEYVLTYFAHAGWRIPAASVSKLRLDAFRKWAATNLGRHRPQRQVGTKRDTLALQPPGHDLEVPSMAQLKDRKRCLLLDEPEEKIASWEATVSRLGATPISAASRKQFLDRLARLGQVNSDVVWVSTKPALLYLFVAGCVSDKRSARRYLAKALALEQRRMPTNTGSCASPVLGSPDAPRCGRLPSNYGSREAPLEWGFGGTRALYTGRLACPGGSWFEAKRLGPRTDPRARRSHERLDEWEIRCGAKTRTWFVSMYRCHAPCPPAGFRFLPYRAHLDFQQAEKARNQGRLAIAVAAALRAVRQAPWSQRYQSLLALVLRRSGRYDEALAAIDAVLSASPDNPYFRLRRAVIIGKKKNLASYDAVVAQLLKELPPSHKLVPHLKCRRTKGLERLHRRREARALAAEACQAGEKLCCAS